MSDAPKDKPHEERLQKILARAGVTSRRKAEELIVEGRVTVNGQPAELGQKADPANDSIKLDGKRVFPSKEHRYLLLNKPRGVMSTVSDPAGRPTVIELVPPALRKALVPVGRLDFMTEGLLLLTDDGDFAQQVAHPRFGCRKTYEVKVKGRPTERDLDKLRAGVVLEGKKTAPCRIEARRVIRTQKVDSDNSWWNVELAEGRSRQIREMFERIGNPVQKLRRVAIGRLTDPNLPVGSIRELTEREVEMLQKGSGPAIPAPRPSRRPADASERFPEIRKWRPKGEAAEEKPARFVPASERPTRFERPEKKRPGGEVGSGRPVPGSERPARFERPEKKRLGGEARGGRPVPGAERPARFERPERKRSEEKGGLGFRIRQAPVSPEPSEPSEAPSEIWRRFDEGGSTARGAAADRPAGPRAVRSAPSGKPRPIRGGRPAPAASRGPARVSSFPSPGKPRPGRDERPAPAAPRGPARVSSFPSPGKPRPSREGRPAPAAPRGPARVSSFPSPGKPRPSREGRPASAAPRGPARASSFSSPGKPRPSREGRPAPAAPRGPARGAPSASPRKPHFIRGERTPSAPLRGPARPGDSGRRPTKGPRKPGGGPKRPGGGGSRGRG